MKSQYIKKTIYIYTHTYRLLVLNHSIWRIDLIWTALLLLLLLSVSRLARSHMVSKIALKQHVVARDSLDVLPLVSME